LVERLDDVVVSPKEGRGRSVKRVDPLTGHETIGKSSAKRSRQLPTDLVAADARQEDVEEAAWVVYNGCPGFRRRLAGG
jgi:hypothetical protein